MYIGFLYHQTYVHLAEEAIVFISDAMPLQKRILTLKRKNPMFYFLFNFYAFLQFMINNPKAQEDEYNLNKALQFTDILGENYHKSVANPFNLPFTEVLDSLFRIRTALQDMVEHGIRVDARKNILELSVQELHLNDILAALVDLIYEYIDQIRTCDAADGEKMEKLYLEIFDAVIKNPLNLQTYRIPPRHQHEVLNRFKEDFLSNLDKAEINFGLSQYPLLFELLAVYYFVYSLSIDKDYLSSTQVPVLLYQKILALIRSPRYQAIYLNLSEYFRYILRHVLRSWELSAMNLL